MKQLATVIKPADYKAFSLRAAEAGVSRRELLRRVVAKYLAKKTFPCAGSPAGQHAPGRKPISQAASRG